MKIALWGVMLLLCSMTVRSQAEEAPKGEVLDEFKWGSDDVAGLNRPPATYFSASAGSGTDVWVDIQHKDNSHFFSTLRVLGPAITSRITAKHYAIVGKMKYANVAAGSYLEMQSYFAPETPGGITNSYMVSTQDLSGPTARIEGTDDGREFALPFDATGAVREPLARIEFRVDMAGAGTIELSEVKLVQYPDTGQGTSRPGRLEQQILDASMTPNGVAQYVLANTTYPDVASLRPILTALHQADPQVNIIIRANPSLPHENIVQLLDTLKAAGITSVSFADLHAASPPPAPEPSSATMERSHRLIFFKGFLLGLAVIPAGALLFFLARKLNRGRHERELRRIASLDT